ncbi:hypothetical protein O7632_24580 [Solwaraspora sp. WMMD406]|uniref:hypothetical protein n=1 Tax=Solwaraspora sp. WMMD406 TaxID=3016095 RepID=UPI002417D72D|nr:hypothetical protein [Solwaraspora sp. WMMD406]MDG4767245.1 hypothetical protein [Solwaraspora sp. WMMD406]
MGTERIAQRILWYGADDWVALHALFGEAKKAVPEPRDAFREEVVAVLDYLLTRELAEVGELAEAGFVPWKGAVAEVIAKVVARCDETGWRLGGFDELWLKNTPNGMRMADLTTSPTKE